MENTSQNKNKKFYNRIIKQELRLINIKKENIKKKINKHIFLNSKNIF